MPCAADGGSSHPARRPLHRDARRVIPIAMTLTLAIPAPRSMQVACDPHAAPRAASPLHRQHCPPPRRGSSAVRPLDGWRCRGAGGDHWAQRCACPAPGREPHAAGSRQRRSRLRRRAPVGTLNAGDIAPSMRLARDRCYGASPASNAMTGSRTTTPTPLTPIAVLALPSQSISSFQGNRIRRVPMGGWMHAASCHKQRIVNTAA